MLRSIWLPAAFALGLGLLTGYLLWPVAMLELYSSPPDRECRLVLTPLPGQRLALGFEHSVFKVEQVETYTWLDGRLLLESVYFGSFDALNYYDPLGLFPRQRRGSGYEIFFYPPRPLELKFAFSQSAKGWLQIGNGMPIPLADLAMGLGHFSISVSHAPRIWAWLRKPLNGNL